MIVTMPKLAMQNDTNAFYDAIAEHYPMFFKDWETQLEREGIGLRSIFRDKGIMRVLDAACGAGTQAIPLAQLGYEVVAVDPSAGMLRKALRTATKRGLRDQIQFVRSDFAHLGRAVDGPFDALVCKGNSLPHLLTDAEIEGTLQTFYNLLRPGGVLVVGLRDFEALLEHRPRFLPGLAHVDHEGNEFISFDVWEWQDGPPVIATQNLYITHGQPDNLQTIKRSVSFRPLSTDEVKVALMETDFEDIQEKLDRSEQVLIARRPLGR